MEFHEKLRALRTENGLTQEQLAQKLYVSRTAVSKWESGKGYPNIDSLKAISTLFGVSLDELLTENAPSAQAEPASAHWLAYLPDVLCGLLLFLPLYAKAESGFIRSVSLFAQPDVSAALLAAYAVLLTALPLTGFAQLLLHFKQNVSALHTCQRLSMFLFAAALLLFLLSRQPYASALLLLLAGAKLALNRQKTAVTR